MFYCYPFWREKNLPAAAIFTGNNFFQCSGVIIILGGILFI